MSITAVKPIIIKKPTAIQEEVRAYVPPHLRGQAKQQSSIKTKLHEDDEAPDTCLKVKSVEKDNDPAALLQKKIKAIKKVNLKKENTRVFVLCKERK